MRLKVNTRNESFTRSTLFVTFHQWASDESIESLFEELDVLGFRVGTVVNRFAVEVPYGKEEEFSNSINEKDIVNRIFSKVLEGERKKYRKRRKSWLQNKL